MQTKRGSADRVVMALVCVLVGLVSLAIISSIVLLFFAPIVVYVLWNSSRKISDLQRRLAELESPESRSDGHRDSQKAA